MMSTALDPPQLVPLEPPLLPRVRAYSKNKASINGHWDPYCHSDTFLMDLRAVHQLTIFGVYSHTHKVFFLHQYLRR